MEMIQKKLTIGLMILFISITNGFLHGQENSGKKEPDGKKDVLGTLKALPDEVQRLRFIHELGEKKDLEALRVIVNSNLRIEGGKGGEYGEYAAGVYARSLEPDLAIAFCSRLPLGSGRWATALLGLTRHPRAKVIGYFKQIVTSKNTYVRYLCYRFCLDKGWSDLLPFAKEDVSSEEGVNGLSLPRGITIGRMARDYVEKFDH